MSGIPELIDCLCRACGKEWNGLFPNGRDEENGIECPACHQMKGVISSYEQKYYQLIFQVGNAYPDESRHQTALRYLRNAEKHDGGPSQCEKAQ